MPHHRTLRLTSLRTVVAVAAASAAVFATGSVARADAWIYRPITLYSRSAAVDLGFAVAHRSVDSRNGLGMNLELAFGLSSSVELRLRTGLRFGSTARGTRADEYARIFETETYGTMGTDPFANPEIGLRFALIRGLSLQLAFDARFYLPLEEGSDFGFMAGLPLWLRLGIVRIDTGLFIPVILQDPDTLTVLSVPVAVWIQVTGSTWLGPEFGIRRWDQGPRTATTYPFGFGIGSALSPDADLRLRIFFRDIDAQPRDYGVGLAFQFRT